MNTAAQVVVVHGPANPDLDTALELAGLTPVVALGDLRIWAAGPPPAGAPQPASPVPTSGGGPERLLLTVPQAAAALGIGRTMTYQLIRQGDIQTVHVGSCTRIPADTLGDTITRLRARTTNNPRQRPRSGRPSRPGGTIDSLGAQPQSQPQAARADRGPRRRPGHRSGHRH